MTLPIPTLIAPLTNAESCEINAALLNLVMKDPFSGLSSEDAATHLNTLDACWRSMSGVIVVDAGRSRSTCLGPDAYIHDHT